MAHLRYSEIKGQKKCDKIFLLALTHMHRQFHEIFFEASSLANLFIVPAIFQCILYPNLGFFKKFLAPLCLQKLSLGVAVLHVNEGLMDMAMLFHKLQFL